MAMCLPLVVGVVSCKDEVAPDPNNGSGGNGDGTGNGTEHVMEEVHWFESNENLPTQNMRDNYQSTEFHVDKDWNYTWTWTKKNGEKTVFKGYVLLDPTQSKHTNGNIISIISVNVTSLNGQPAPGGWQGIYTYGDDGELLMNIEPSVTGWNKYPSNEEGIGSGTSGMESVYTFTKR